MKRDWKLLVALLVLIGLVIWLLVISLDRSKELESVKREISELRSLTVTPPPSQPVNGKTPVLGIDYFNGAPGKNGNDGKDGRDGFNGKDGADGASAYQLALKSGFVGTEQQWLNSLKGKDGAPAPELEIDCQEGHVAKKYTSDTFWQLTNIKCEVDHD